MQDPLSRKQKGSKVRICICCKLCVHLAFLVGPLDKPHYCRQHTYLRRERQLGGRGRPP